MPSFVELAKVTLFGSGNKDGVKFDPAKDIPAQDGKVILITGAASGIGQEAARELAEHKAARIYIADLPRSPEDEAAAIAAVRGSTETDVRFLGLNLGSFESIQKAAAEFRAAEEKLDVLLLNAGIMRVKTSLTPEGYEEAFGINYVGHTLFAKLLLPTLQATADSRLVIVSSEGHVMAPKGGIQFDNLKTPCDKMSFTQRYGQSKLALIFLTRDLAREFPQVKVVAVHPGRIATNMGVGLAAESLLIRMTGFLGKFIVTTVDIGARNHLWACTSPAIVSGKYYEPVGVPDREGKIAHNDELAKKLREWTEAELKGKH
ncbi:hypothetical protein BX600DRAFT_118822 [Xylariales sp. PMI_506]|nr:hypothetical protein BX600DRAFT_118822 [Xylariales sp. PMI_506]